MPKFINTTGVKQREQPLQKKQYETAPNTKSDTIKKTLNTKGLFSRTAEENEKIPAPKKDYLESDVQNKYKQVENVEKPRFVNKNVNDDQPHFVEINKNEDVKIKYF